MLTCSSRLTCNRRRVFVLRVFTLCVFLFLSERIFAQSNPEYERLIEEEQKAATTDRSYEYVASGVAAIVIGLYGYYNTNPNPVVKLLYAATQTAGVLTVGQGMKTTHGPNLTLEIDEVLRRSHSDSSVSSDEVRKAIVRNKANTTHAETITQAYTASILSGLYFYNGFREASKEPTLRNIYYFLGFNFAIAGGVGFYRHFHRPALDLQSGEVLEEKISISLAPLPTISYRF